MTNILRYTSYAFVAVMLTFGAFGLMATNVSAQLDDVPTTTTTDSGPLTADDLLSSDFTGATGLGSADLETTAGNLIRVVIGFLGIIAVVVVLLGGFKWMTAGGSDDKVADAKRLLIAGLVGLGIILTAWAITEFVIRSILGATQ